ncbi:MAG: DUF4019 domain-containing protein [Candidatus Eremiobacteraeota bacterium]|nr:DUF4019 domain-containing protein [Candidatus Eremiobacteraeota bacterium]
MKKSHVLFIAVAFFAAGLVCSAAATADEAREKAAVASSGTWLALVDKGSYDKAWDQASAYFKGAVTKAGLEASLKGVRDPLGKVLSRKLKSKTYSKTLPGAPDGEYVIIQYDTSFQKKAAAVETVTPMLDKDGKWRVSGYYIK